jgi:hypothetical protein
MQADTHFACPRFSGVGELHRFEMVQAAGLA